MTTQLLIDTANALVNVLADAGIIIGIKVDTGAKDMAGHPGERITEGLDGLRARQALLHRAKCNRAACHGEYDAPMESRCL